jgi:hypothetical protein
VDCVAGGAGNCLAVETDLIAVFLKFLVKGSREGEITSNVSLSVSTEKKRGHNETKSRIRI